jgi:hypothetical protein
MLHAAYTLRYIYSCDRCRREKEQQQQQQQQYQQRLSSTGTGTDVLQLTCSMLLSSQHVDKRLLLAARHSLRNFTCTRLNFAVHGVFNMLLPVSYPRMHSCAFLA